MKKTCPKCGLTFECLHDENMAACHCASVPLKKVHLGYLKSHYSDCLCHACLLAVIEELSVLKSE